MLVVMQENATDEQIQNVIDRMVALNFTVHRSTGVMHTVLGGVGPEDDINPVEFEVLEGVKEAHRIASPYKLASRSFRPGGTIGSDQRCGDRRATPWSPWPVLAASKTRIRSKRQPRSSRAQAQKSSAAGRSSPAVRHTAFKGSANPDCSFFAECADRHKLLVVSEVMDQTQIPMMLDYVDIFQVGARNMQNFKLLRELGKVKKPVLLKRGIAATIEELLLSAEYLLSGGNYNVILCERGIRTFETYTRNTMDISAIPIVKKLSHLPIMADPSHGTGRRDQVLPMARAAVAAGADGSAGRSSP